MSKREDYKRFIVFCLASLVVLAQAAVFAWVWYSVYRGQIDEPFWRKGNWVLIAIYGLMFALFAKLYGGLKVGYLKRIDVFYSLTLALLCTNVVEYLEKIVCFQEPPPFGSVIIGAITLMSCARHATFTLSE